MNLLPIIIHTQISHTPHVSKEVILQYFLGTRSPLRVEVHHSQCQFNSLLAQTVLADPLIPLHPDVLGLLPSDVLLCVLAPPHHLVDDIPFIILILEQRLDLQQHLGQDQPCSPDINLLIIIRPLQQHLWGFITVSPHLVLQRHTLISHLRQPEVQEHHLLPPYSLFLRYQNVTRFDIPMHDSFGVQASQSHQQLKGIEFDLGESEVLDELVESVPRVILEHEPVVHEPHILHYFLELLDMGATLDCPEHPGFSLDLVLYDLLEEFDDHLLIGSDIKGAIDPGCGSLSEALYQLVIVFEGGGFHCTEQSPIRDSSYQIHHFITKDNQQECKVWDKREI